MAEFCSVGTQKDFLAASLAFAGFVTCQMGHVWNGAACHTLPTAFYMRGLLKSYPV